GTIADRVTALLRARGFEAPLIDTGEMRLPGAARRRVVLPEAGLALRLAECAVATSAPGALRFGPGRHHLFDPRDGRSPGLWRSVSVIAPEAETADALSTAFAVSEPERIGDLVPQGVGVVATDSAGRVRHFGRTPALAEA
ncbi:MAG: FAD:protein FMN transferase, partial [Rhodobacteraceae bacterium]|nr:FAD:protein FMN transferase [Paracoccaceae bacterium]